MRECDIWADGEPGSCGGAPEKSPHKPFVHSLSLLTTRKRGGGGEACFIVTPGRGKNRIEEHYTESSCVSVPEDCVTGATRFQGDAVPDFVANVDIHLVSHSQGEIDHLLGVNLGANHHAMLEVD